MPSEKTTKAESDRTPGILFSANPRSLEKYSEETMLKLREMDLDSGLLGKLFGSPRTAPLNIAGTVSIICLVAASCFTIWTPKDLNPLEMWKIVMPVITLILGYTIGKKH